MVEKFSFVKEAFNFSNDSVQVIKTSFGPNGLDCIVSSVSGALLVTNNGFEVLKSLSFQSSLGRFMFRSFESFYNCTGDFSKKYFILTWGLLCEVLGVVEGDQETPRQRLLRISQGLDVVLVNILPTLLRKDVGLTIEGDTFKSMERNVVAVIKTHLNGKFSPKCCNELTNMLKTLIFESNSTIDIMVLKSRVETLIDKFSEIFWEVPGSPLSSSTVLPGIVIPRGFLTMLQKLPNETTDNPFKFILLGSSLGYDLPQSKTVLELKDSQKVKVMLDWRAKYIENVIQMFSNRGIKLIISSEALPETFVHFCNQFQMAAIQLLPKEDMRRICNIFNISPMFEVELEEGLSPFVGEACNCNPVRVGQHTYVYLKPAKMLAKQVLLCASSEPMCRQYSVALQNALKSVRNAFKKMDDGRHILSVVSGGGVFELGLAFALERYRKENQVEPNIERACRVLENALLFIPRQLVENLGRKLSFCCVTAQARKSFTSGTILLGLSKNGDLCNLCEEGVLEPLIGNYQLVSSVIQLFTQIARTDQIIHVKELPKNNTSDSDDSCHSQDDN